MQDQDTLSSTQSDRELKTERFHLKVVRKPHCMIEYDIECFEELTKEAYGKAVKAVSKEVSMQGFRKGRAPEELVIKHYTPQIEKQWQEEIANLAYKEAASLDK